MIECLIAAIPLSEERPVLAADRDLDATARHVVLRTSDLPSDAPTAG